ncbi:uncharacterized protein LOC130014810 [Mercurialis annua]|uniref:uncharacterized protein LOC130014810 n=1 Tax=Mercurialis annua TaxID=3986 RepID=UPI0024AE12DF|nr:uncharacterized protein LOC130014810 [Mercurialis annua]
MANDFPDPPGFINAHGDNIVIPQGQTHQNQQRPNNNRQRQPTLIEFFQPIVGNTTHGYFAHPVQANNFEIKTICSTVKLGNMTEDEVWLRLFPFSLRDKARVWIQSLSRVGINTWQDLAKAFLNKYFLMAKTAKLTMLYQKMDGESLYDAWERSTIDATIGGSLMRKTTNAAFELLNELAMNNCSWPIERARAPLQRGVMVVSLDPAMETLKSKNEALQAQVDFLTREAATTNISNAVTIHSNYEVCGDYGHVASDCYVTGHDFSEQVNYVEGQRLDKDPYFNTYNPVWRNHPNFSWKDNGGNAKAQVSSNFQGGPRPQQYQGNFNNHEETRQTFKNYAATIHRLDLQNAQMAKALLIRNQGGLLSTTEANPREQVKEITLRSSKVLPEPHEEKVVLEEEKEQCEVGTT